jgi:hypothetical protein
MALATAERDLSELSLNRAFIANELVEASVQPARSAYRSQSFGESEAIPERARCEAARRRISQLRACATAAA